MNRSLHCDLADLEVFLSSGGRLTENPFKCLLHRALSASPWVRERALLLLLDPPVMDPIGHFLDLLVQLRRHRSDRSEWPGELWDWLLECFVCAHFDGASPSKAWLDLTAKVPWRIWRRFLLRPLSARPFLPLRGAAIPAFERLMRLRYGPRRWRLLRKELIGLTDVEPWAEITLRDLAGSCRRRSERRQRGPEPRAPLCLGRALTAPPVDEHGPGPIACCARRPFGDVQWLGIGRVGGRYLESVLALQAEELIQVRRLAMELSRRTRRVVLSCHNAGLAAMSGWAFEPLDRQFPDRSLWQQFRRRVESAGASVRAGAPDVRLLDLWELWQQRLVIPKRRHASWEEALSRRLRAFDNPALPASGERRPGLSRELVQSSADLSDSLSWSGPLQPCQHLDAGRLRRWAAARQAHWLPGFSRLQAMLTRGHELLAEERLDRLVLPWIDKFFISSKRRQDGRYLSALLTWLTALPAPPLILLWEDSIHPRNPSLTLALASIHGLRWRGIGRFDPAGSDRRDALEIIRREHDRFDLFVLRPVSDVHHPESLQHLLSARPPGFLQRYDSAWKDNQVCLYTGTQVYPLLSIQTDIEPLPCWVAAHGRKLPLGAFLRNRLRQMNLGPAADERRLDPLAAAWRWWAALG